MVKPTGKVAPADQTQRPAQEVAPKKGDGLSQIAAPDEFVRKISRQGVEFSRRFATGLRYLNQAYMDEIEGRVRAEEEWETAFRDVISDILEKSGMNYDNVVEFAFKQYRQFLRDHPVEKERVKKFVARMREKSKNPQTG